MKTFKTITGAISIMLIVLASCSNETQKVPLTSLDLTFLSQGWGQPQINKGVTGKEMSIAGVKYAVGLGTHSISQYDIDLNRKGITFSALTGVDDGAAGQPAKMNFKITGDGEILWESGIMKAGDPAKKAEVDLKGIRKISLIVEDGGDGGNYDHANWAEAFFTVKGDIAAYGPRIRVIEDQIILTPKVAPKPRINGARIFGVRPGSPFLFTIAATGNKPMKYSVEGLPEGLSCDQATGQISGIINKPGEYKTTFIVSNELGEAKRDFKIVCGDNLALTPHMGWNSWYIWENNVTDKIMREAADAMISTGLADHGYSYVNIDDCWSVKAVTKDSSLMGEPRDANGMINPNKRFPDMKALTDYIHAKGLKAGIYTSPGRLTCGGYVSALGYEEKDIARFTEWGYDFLKYDWCTYDEVGKRDNLTDLKRPYILINELLKKQNRDIILNLCQYGLGDVWKWGKEVGGHSWRTAGDLGGSFNDIGIALFRDGFDVYTKDSLHLYAGPGGWNDPDYLLFGYLSNWRGETVPTPLTPNEQYTQISLWSLVAAPLILSGDITRLDEFTLSILSNDEIIDVDQDPLGKPGYRVSKTGNSEVWIRHLEDGSVAVGLFNRDEKETKVTALWSDLNISGKQNVRDLWRQKDLGKYDNRFTAKVPRHGVVMLKMVPVK